MRRQEAVVQVRTYLDRADKARASGDWTEAARLYSDAYKTLSQVGQSSSTDEYRRVAAGITEVSVHEADDAIRRGDYELAIERLDYALRVDPTSVKAQRAREDALQKKSLVKNRVTSKEVREHGEDLTALKDRHAQMVHDAQILYEMGSYEKANEKLEAVLKEDPTNTAAQYYQKLLEEKYLTNLQRQRQMVADAAIVDVARTWVITTNAQNLPVPNIMAKTNLVHTGLGRQKILNKLDRISVGEVKFDGIPLAEAARWLQTESIKNDPDGAGINFLINNTIDQQIAGMENMYTDFNSIDPTTGEFRPGGAMMLGMGGGMMGGGGPMGGGGGMGNQQASSFIGMYTKADIGTYSIRVDPPLRNVRLADALDAITKVSDRPIKYTVEDYAIVFTARLPENAQFFNRTFKVDPNTFWQGLYGANAEEVGGYSSEATSGSNGESSGGYVTRIFAAGGGSGNGSRSNSSGNGGGGSGLPYITQVLQSVDMQEDVRRFFTAVTGVNFMTGLSQGQAQMVAQMSGNNNLSGMMQMGGMGNQMFNQNNGQQTGTAIPGHTLVFNDRTGNLFVRSTTEVLDVIEQVIQTLNAPPPQLTIEVKFVEVGQDDSKALGFDWYLGNYTFGGKDVGAQGGTAPSYSGTPSESNPTGIFPYPAQNTSATDQLVTSGLDNSGIPAIATVTGILTNPQFRVVIRAMEAREGVDVMSCPKVTTISGRQAQILTAMLRSIVTGSISQTGNGGTSSAGSGGTVINESIPEIQYDTTVVTTGPSLDVVPYVSADGYSIQMTLIPSVVQFLGYGNSDVPEAANFEKTLMVRAGELESPVPLPRFMVRQVLTSVVVWDGQTVMLGGLISEETGRSRQKVPILGDIPLLGRLFRSESNVSAKKNLIIFVTPQIIDPAGNPLHDLTDVENLPYNPNSVPVQSDSKVRMVPGTQQAGL